MFINDLAEPTLIVIYPGQFQPFVHQHYLVYQYLTGKFGRNNVFVATSSKTDDQHNLFSFAEKAYFMHLAGVPADRIIQASQPHQIDNILASGQIQISDPKNTVAVMAVSREEMEHDPRYNNSTTRDGGESYLLPLKNIKDTESINTHCYLTSVKPVPMHLSSDARSEYESADSEDRRDLISKLFGTYSHEIEQILNHRFGQTPPVNHITTVDQHGVQEDAAGVGVVKGGKDPRYVMATTGNQNAVTAKTPNMNLDAFMLRRKIP